MLRRFFTKNKSLNNVSDQAIKAAQDLIKKLYSQAFKQSM